MGNLFLILLLFLSRIIFIAPLPIYFDGPEYVRLITSSDLLSALTLGHPPIHPGFILPVWIAFKIFPFPGPVFIAEFITALFSALGLFIFYKIVKLLCNRTSAFKSLIIASLLPVLWLSGINVLVESTYIFFYLLSFYCLLRFIKSTEKKWLLFGFLSLGYSIFSHVQVLIWMPLFFSPLFLYPGKLSFKKIILFLAFGIFSGVGVLVVLLWINGTSFNQTFFQLFGHGGDFIISTNPLHEVGVYLRNLEITLLRNNSTLVILGAVIGSVVLFKKNKKLFGALILWIIPVLLTSQYWHIGLFGRISLIASFPIAILSSQIKSRLFFIILVLNLLLISIPLVYSNKYSTVQEELHRLYTLIPKNSVLISSNLIRPQVAFTGTKYFVNEPGQNNEFIVRKIDIALQQKRKVYIDSQALFNPYYSLDGNTLHILSLNKVGSSQINTIFQNYNIHIVKVIDSYNRIFLYRINGVTAKSKSFIRGKTKPGTEVIRYSSTTYDKVSHLRVDRYDIGTWAWYFIAGRKDPLFWVISDKTGEYEIPKVY